MQSHDLLLHELETSHQENKEKSEFLSMATHQLRTPLSGMKWTFKMLLDGDLGSFTPEQRTIIQQGYDNSERMVKLLEEIIRANQNDRWDFTYDFSLIDVVQVIDTVISEFADAARAHKVLLSFPHPSRSPGLVEADAEKLAIVIQNLVENAIKYNRENGSVSIAVESRGTEVVITVKDTGIGIPPEQIHCLFAKFFRADNAKEFKKDGSGLGLFTAKKIIERHGGRLEVESALGKGTCFSAILPLKQAGRTV